MLVKQAERPVLAFPILALGYVPQTIGHCAEMSSSKEIFLGTAPDLPGLVPRARLGRAMAVGRRSGAEAAGWRRIAKYEQVNADNCQKKHRQWFFQ